METRLVCPADAPLLATLHAESFSDAKWSTEHFTSNLALPTTQGWIASHEKIPQGFILYQIVEDEIEILTFCVTPVARRTGIGHAILNTVLISAKDKNVRRIFLDVAIDNHGALALYVKTGFHVVGKRTAYYLRGSERIDAVLLEYTFK
jgi:ribosomal-protein-alanine N-acetyltransferase